MPDPIYRDRVTYRTGPPVADGAPQFFRTNPPAADPPQFWQVTAADDPTPKFFQVSAP